MDDAIALLEQDLRKLRRLLSELVDPTDEAATTRSELLQRVDKELDVHARIMEEVFFPALKDEANRHHATVSFQASADHRAVERMVIPDLKHTEPGTPEFTGRARVLQEMVENHAREEEQSMFTRARELFSPDQLADLGRRLDARKRELR